MTALSGRTSEGTRMLVNMDSAVALRLGLAQSVQDRVSFRIPLCPRSCLLPTHGFQRKCRLADLILKRLVDLTQSICFGHLLLSMA